MRNLISRLYRDESGATAIEYAMIASFIGLAIITVLQNVATEVTGTFNDVQSGLQKRPAV